MIVCMIYSVFIYQLAKFLTLQEEIVLFGLGEWQSKQLSWVFLETYTQYLAFAPIKTVGLSPLRLCLLRCKIGKLKEKEKVFT